MDRRQQAAKQRERKLRAKYRRNIRIVAVLCLVLGLAGGFFLGRYVTQRSEQPVQKPVVLATVTPEPQPTAAPVGALGLALEEQATPEPTAVPTAVPTPAPTPVPETRTVVVPYGSAQSFSVQMNNDGTTRLDNASQTFETLNFTLKVERYMTPEYYKENYETKYQMQGNEAGIEFELTLNDYMGSQTVEPQELFVVGLETETGVTESGFQLTDAEIRGESNVTVMTNVPRMLYKRFAFSKSVGDMAYMTVQTVENGVTTKYMFELGKPIRPEITPVPTAEPTPEVTLKPIGLGEESDAVRELQEMLLELGYLEGSADGQFGAKTEKAVKAAQAEYGMTETGVANHALQKALQDDLKN